MKNTIKKMAGLIFIAMAMASCSKNENKAEEGIAECSYKITIDGKTTTANRFGQDWMTFTSQSYEGDAGFSLSIVQTKANGQQDPVFDFSSGGARFNRETPVGTTYTANLFHAFQLGAPEFDGFEYDKGRLGNDGEITLTVTENSSERIRFNVSGTVMKWKGGVENPQEVALASVDAELVFGRANYHEMTSGGVILASANCDCRER